MAWYDPTKWIKNTSVTLKKAKGWSSQQDDTVVQNEAPTVSAIDLIQQTVDKELAPITTTPTKTTTAGNSLTEPWTLGTISIQKNLDKIAKAWEKFTERAKANAEKSSQLEWFSLDPYNVLENTNVDSPFDSTVDSKNYENSKLTWQKAREKAWEDMDKEKTTWWVWTDLWRNYKNMANQAMNTIEKKYPSIGKTTVASASKQAFWGELAYKAPNGKTYKYDDPNPTVFTDDLKEYLALEDQYKQGQLWEYYMQQVKDSLYDTYKDSFYIYPWREKTKDPAFWRQTIDRGTFFNFIENEKVKSEFQEDEYERRWIDTAATESESRLAQAWQYAVNQIWDVVANSAISTVDARQEYMDDVSATFQSVVWRWDAAMRNTFKTKAWLQDKYHTTDLNTIDESQMDAEDRDMWNTIKVNESNYAKFIENLTRYYALTVQYANPETWKIDSLPDAVVDPTTWKTYTYQQLLFDWVSVINVAWWNSYGWVDMQSPYDVLLKYSDQLAFAKAEQTEWLLWRMWERVQYRTSNTLWAFTNEASQQTLWRLWAWWWNILSKESWEVPFEFVDMDTSTLATITTNNSRTWRLMQKYATNVLEYWPELIGSIIEAVLLDKWLSKFGSVKQLQFQNWLNKYDIIKNTSAGQRFAKWLAYTIRWAERLWTDQLIDAALAIWDTEQGSKLSKRLSIWGTLLWEWIWILSDLKVLGKWFNKFFWWKYDGLTDPFELMADNPWILDDYAASLWRYATDDTWKLIRDEAWNLLWDERKLLLQDLSTYSKYLKDISSEIETVVRAAVNEWADLGWINKSIKEMTYNVLKQVFAQNTAMAKAITNLVTDDRANIADIVKYIWNLQWVIKVWPYISTIKMVDNGKNLVDRTAIKYDRNLDLIIDWWLTAWLNRWLTRREVEELASQNFIKTPNGSIDSVLDDYFIPVKNDNGDIVYYATEKWLKSLWVDSSIVNVPLAIVAMSDDTKQLIDKLKSLPKTERIWDELLDVIGETNTIDGLAERIAGIDLLWICK